MVGEDKEVITNDSDTDENYSSYSDTTTTSEAEEAEEEEEEKEEKEVGNDNITDLESDIDSNEQELRDLLQQAGEAIPESLCGDDSEFLIYKAEETPCFDKSVYATSDQDSPLPPQRSECTSRPPSQFGDYQAHRVAAHLVATELKTFAEATTGEYQDEWNQSMKPEYDALMEHPVWEVIPHLPNRKVVGSRWHYIHKLEPTGEITRRKSRFVAKGYSQVKGID